MEQEKPLLVIRYYPRFGIARNLLMLIILQQGYLHSIRKVRHWKQAALCLIESASYSPQHAIARVAQRVSEGGHHIPDDVVVRRYYRGLYNLVNLYIPKCDKWMVLDNMDLNPEVIAKSDEFGKVIVNDEIWSIIQQQSDGTK